MPNNQIQSLTISGTTYDIVDNISGYITADSPALTGTPTAPTPLSGAGDTQIATVKYVQDAMAGAGAGTVTSVGVANATDGGLSVSGSPITGSGTIGVGHSNVLASAQTTSGIYPIKIDKNGHISEYGSAVSIPTNTSELTNDSNFVSPIDLSDNLLSTLYYLNVSGSTASLVNASSAPISIASAAAAFRSVSGVQIAQVLNVSGSNFKLRMYDIVDADTINGTIRLVAVDDDTVYVADLADAGSGLTGTISTTTMLTSETDPTVPSWAKASSKPTYTASEVGALPSSTTYVSKITTTAGAHTAISNQSGSVSFNVPTKTSHLTNDSGFITSDSDENVKSTTVTAATTNYIVGSTSSSTTTGGLSKHASGVLYTTADSGTSGYTQLRLGNTTATSSAGGKEGQIRLYGTTATYYVDLKAGAPSANRTITFPNKAGTIALTSDIPTVPTIFLNDSSTTSASFYAPTTAGTSGYVLTSNGSGAPTWAAASSGSSYTATSPIDITGNDISHEDSGVTAGTYDGGGVKSTGFYVPSITVDAKGHVTSATDLGNLIPVNTYNSSDPVHGMLLTTTSWGAALRSASSYWQYILTSGNTSYTTTISTDTNSYYNGRGYFRVADVQAFDAVSFEPVIVDWSTSGIQSGGSSLTLTVSIASAYTNNILIWPILTYCAGM